MSDNNVDLNELVARFADYENDEVDPHGHELHSEEGAGFYPPDESISSEAWQKAADLINRVQADNLAAAPRYDEGWQGAMWRWLARRINLFARRLPYTHLRIDVRYHVLEPLADKLVWRAIRRGMAERG